MSPPQTPAAAAKTAFLAGDALRRAGTWIFDLDNTLYPARCNLFAQIDQRMGEFICSHFGIALEDAKRQQKGFFNRHGTTLRGLMVEHGIDPAAFLEYVHDIDVSVLPPAPDLDAALQRLPGRKMIYTNGTVAHAARVLQRLGIAHHFETVFDIVSSDYLPKPQEAPYRKLLAAHDVDPRRAVMVEDMARNLVPAAALGMTTIWIPTAESWSAPVGGDEHIHHVAPDLTAFLRELTKG